MENISSIKEIAKRCGVSASTVSRVLNGKDCISAETRERVLAAVDECNFRPNLLAKSLKNGEARTICFLVPTYGNLIFPEIMRGMTRAARQNGYTIFISITDEDSEAEEATYNEMRNHQVEGFIICSAIGDESAIYRMREEGVPLVLVNRFKKEDIGRLDTVSINNYRAGYDSAQFLIRSGRRRIAVLCGDPELYLYNERLRGYKDALADAGLEADPDLILEEPPEGQAGFYPIVQEIMNSPKRPDAFFATADPKAFVVMHALHDLGVKIPEEAAVIGIDNVELSAYMEPPLTTIAQPLAEMGERAMNRLLAQIEYKKKNGVLPPPENLELPFEVMVRKSTG